MPFDKQILDLLEETCSFLEFALKLPAGTQTSLVIDRGENMIWGLQITENRFFAMLSSDHPDKILLIPRHDCRAKMPAKLHLGLSVTRDITPYDVVQRARDAVIVLTSFVTPIENTVGRGK